MLLNSVCSQAGTSKPGKGARLPPVVYRLDPVVHHQAATVGHELLAGADQLLALAMQGARLFFGFRRDPDQGKRIAVAFYVAVQLLAERLGIAPIGLHPLVPLVELLRADHMAMNAERAELALQSKAEAAGFVDGVERDFRVRAAQLRRPREERSFGHALGRLGQAAACLHHHHVKGLMQVDSNLDRATAAIKLTAGSLG